MKKKKTQFGFLKAVPLLCVTINVYQLHVQSYLLSLSFMSCPCLYGLDMNY